MDGNGDATLEEMEMTLVELHRERLGLAASMRDVDSAVGRLDNILMGIFYIVAVSVLQHNTVPLVDVNLNRRPTDLYHARTSCNSFQHSSDFSWYLHVCTTVLLPRLAVLTHASQFGPLLADRYHCARVSPFCSNLLRDFTDVSTSSLGSSSRSSSSCRSQELLLSAWLLIINTLALNIRTM